VNNQQRYFGHKKHFYIPGRIEIFLMLLRFDINGYKR